MCSQVQCRKCGKITWSGCGQHVSEVMRGVQNLKCALGTKTIRKNQAFSPNFSVAVNKKPRRGEATGLVL